MTLSDLVVLPVAGPLAVAGLILPFGHLLPRRVPDVIAILVAVAACALCGFLAAHAGPQPIVAWFGDWTPRPGVDLGISFAVDQAGAAVASFIGLLFAAAMLFAWGYFDEIHAHFQVLMLLFMGGMIGFCLTHDLFNMFVWFEVMSVAGFALTGYQLRTSALEAALNFTVVNTLGAYLILGGIGLIYARVGALDFTALSDGISRIGPDPVITASFALLACGFLIKAAQVPFQFWLPDAHGVAPSPVSVIFSGAMVALGVFGVARLLFSVFAEVAAVQHVAHTLLLGMGIASGLVGGAMALLQRHVKRMLAFSTISHTGVMLTGLALLSQNGTAGVLSYLLGHGLVKGALFMVAGILLALCGGIDEIALRGRGRDVWPAGLAMGLGGLLLAGLPFGLMDRGGGLMAVAADGAGLAWLHWAIMAAGCLTGAAVLRATARIFLGWGDAPTEGDQSPTEPDQEKADRPLWLMLLPCLLLLALAIGGTQPIDGFLTAASRQMMQAGAHVAPGQAPAWWTAWLSVGLAVALAGFDLGKGHLPRLVAQASETVTNPVVTGLQALHSGLIGDYVAWAVVGVALFALMFV